MFKESRPSNFKSRDNAYRADSTLSHPDEVLSDPVLTTAEKAAILASWASDARAVQDAPALRQLDSGAVVEIDAIMHALAALDEPKAPLSRGVPFASRRRPKSLRATHWFGRKRWPDDDGSPPPSAPALALLPVGAA